MKIKKDLGLRIVETPKKAEEKSSAPVVSGESQQRVEVDASLKGFKLALKNGQTRSAFSFDEVMDLPQHLADDLDSLLIELTPPKAPKNDFHRDLAAIDPELAKEVSAANLELMHKMLKHP